MFTPIVIICVMDMSSCIAQVHPTLFRTEKECYDNLAAGIALFEERKFIVQDYRCIDWGSKT